MNTAEDVRHMSADIKMNALRVLCIQLGFLIFSIKGTDGVPGCSDTIEAICHLRPSGSDSTVSGTVEFHQGGTCYHGQIHPLVRVQGEITGLTPSVGGYRKHGFHVHTYGNLSERCQATGPHYNPLGTVHGRPADTQNRRHVGDLGNVLADQDGNVNIDFIAPRPVSLIGDLSIIGRAIVLHAGEDDLGRGGNAGSVASGNAGARIACCIIERVHK
ncbi:superoxide dismutase [Cu-Zn]-like [Ruditapes philippinarum]|uniref:superoxide dismutase [Cu-Zn]-like n=1 Tax=Ruditapes philippinarum TaxID=129788 RepID=UPI00295A8616|nr:superoxide dismutase [Cu-Zn]-like [Ruditapes philippinarum]